jgi:MarR family transcriptional regulator, organic hydroperoxide resistance regulator
MKRKVDMRENLFFVFGSLARAIARTVQKDLWLLGVDVTFEQGFILFELEHRNGQPQQQLAEATDKDEPSITRLIDNMIKHGLVLRVTDAKDRRVNLIHLTTKGRKIQKKLISHSQKHLEELLRDVKAEDLQIWFQVMDNFLNNNKQIEEHLTKRIEQLQLKIKLKTYRQSKIPGDTL